MKRSLRKKPIPDCWKSRIVLEETLWPIRFKGKLQIYNYRFLENHIAIESGFNTYSIRSFVSHSSGRLHSAILGGGYNHWPCLQSVHRARLPSRI